MPKLGTIAHQYLVFKPVLGNFEIPSPSHFLPPYLQNNAQFSEHEMFKAIFWKRNKKRNQKSLAPFCRPKLAVHVSKIKKTCLWCSQIESNSSADTVFWIHFLKFYQRYPVISYLFRFAFQIAFNKKEKRIKVRPQMAKITFGPTLTP